MNDSKVPTPAVPKNVLQVKKVRASSGSRPGKKSFDFKAKDFLQNAGFSGLKKDEHSERIIAHASSNELRFILEYGKKEGKVERNFRLIQIRARGEKWKLLDKGKVIYGPDIPESDTSCTEEYEVIAQGGMVFDWTFAGVKANPELVSTTEKIEKDPRIELDEPEKEPEDEEPPRRLTA